MFRQVFRLLLLCVPFSLLMSGRCVSQDPRPPVWQPDSAGFNRIVAPFFRTHCLRCHGPVKAEGRLRVDQHLLNEFLAPSAREKWGEVINVLNSHEMPPEEEKQPSQTEVAAVVDWITGQMTRAELIRRDSVIVLRRLNRDEYRRTIRDLIGVDFDTSGFPQDPPAGGFDNNGRSLTMSPLLTELYFDAAQKVLDRALVEGSQPPSIRWRFEPETGDSDSNRKNYDGQSVIVNGGNNRVERGFKILHHESWDRGLNARSYRMKHAGEYIIRVRAGGTVPARKQVVEAARQKLQARLSRELKENPKGERWHREALQNDLRHFETDRMYDYGPPRLKLIVNLGGQPRTIAEFDVDATVEEPKVYEFRTRFTTEDAGITLQYAYDIPRVLENFWFQTADDFARPEAWVDWFELEGPVYDQWPPAAHQRLVGRIPDRSGEEAHVRTLLASFMRRAWRRPVTAEEIDSRVRLFVAARRDAESFLQAIRVPLISVLVSPHFLYLTEPEVAGPARARTLNDHELAARLSYFLWSSMPDEELFRLADSGKLASPEILTAQVGRLLADPKSEALVTNFAGQWLGLREVGANPPAADLYPQYDRHLETSMVEESRAFFREILQHDLDVMNFVGSDFVVINERLARFYGIPDVRGDSFRRVAVPDGIHRGGVVTQASVLTITSNGTRTSPVKRGTWVLKNLLGMDPGLPVANAGDIAPKVPGIDKATVRQRLEIHRTLPQCARCHNKIDPLGFALENFNAAGEWREREGFGYKGRIGRDDPEIDATSRLPDGTAISGVDGLRLSLRAREDLFLNCLTGKLLTYALGREAGVTDQPAIRSAVQSSRKNGRTLRSLVHFIVLSDAFRSR